MNFVLSMHSQERTCRLSLTRHPQAREDQGVREVIPHIGPIPIIIPLKLFLEGIDFPRIMLPRALRGSW